MPENKTVLITGGARRIGLEIAHYFGAKGFWVILHYHKSEAEAQELCRKLGRCTLIKADLRDTSASLRAFEGLEKVDVLINSASVFDKNYLCNLTQEKFDEDFNIHLKTPLFLMQKFAGQAHFNSENQGNIINIIDSGIVHNATKYPSYLLAKKALWSLTQFAAAEFAPRVRVNAISPGFILPEAKVEPTELAEYTRKKVEKIPLGRRGSPSDIVQALDFLISSSYITGQNITVDGGSSLI